MQALQKKAPNHTPDVNSKFEKGAAIINGQHCIVTTPWVGGAVDNVTVKFLISQYSGSQSQSLSCSVVRFPHTSCEIKIGDAIRNSQLSIVTCGRGVCLIML